MNALNRDLKYLTQKIEKEGLAVQKDRLAFHLMPPVGWLNDPNGLCEFNGEYHVFYQYTPFNAEGGIKFWGHYTSSDMIHWINRGVALYADQPYDCHGVYSGSAFIEANKMHLFYTGNVKQLGEHDYIHTGREHNTVYAVSEDGKTFEHKQCVMTNADYPEDMTCHVRDPKVWQENGVYYMVQGARDKADKGLILVFSSKNLVDWEVINRLETKEKFGYMWECPDLFVLEGQSLLLLSPQGVEPEGVNYHNVYQSGYYKLEGDFKSSAYTLVDFKELDRGFDFYAPQTFEDSQGRRILIGWMGLPDIEDEYTNPTVEAGWQHALTVPRVLGMKDGVLTQMPVKELEQLRKNAQHYTATTATQDVPQVFELDFVTDGTTSFELVLKDSVVMTFESDKQLLTLSFKAGGCGRTQRSVAIEAVHKLKCLVDTSAIEVFVNEGQEVFTTRYYIEQNAPTVSVTSEKEVSITVWEMEAYTVEDDVNQ